MEFSGDLLLVKFYLNFSFLLSFKVKVKYSKAIPVTGRGGNTCVSCEVENHLHVKK
jgi:hypothetical protein